MDDGGGGADGSVGGDGGGDAVATAAAVVCISVHPDSPRWLTVADSVLSVCVEAE